MANRTPPIWRDPWALVTAAAVLPLFYFSRGAPRGEPVAEDFDFLHRALLEPSRSLLDGGGSQAFWRPIGYQVYYRAFGSLILNHPGLVAAVHGALLAVACLLLYGVLRRRWSGAVSAAAASFPLLADSSRTLVCRSGLFSDVGAFLFAALALWLAARGRLWGALSALLAALLCEEVALAAGLLLPCQPGVAAQSGSVRIRALAGTALVIAAWALVYQWVRGHAGLEMPHGLEREPGLLATPLATRLGWAIWNSARATFSLSLKRGPLDAAAGIVVLAIMAASAVLFVRDARARERLRAARGWIAWGAAWCLLSWAALASIFPIWAPNRSQLGSVGFGVAAVALTSAAHPALAGALVAARLGLLALAPATPTRITRAPDDRGAFMDYPRLVRLQRLMRATRRQLHARFPALPRDATVGWHNLPLSAEYAFGGSRALQVWYRDTTLRTISFREFEAHPERQAMTFLSYQPDHEPEVVLLDPDALRWQQIGFGHLREGRWLEAIAALERADSLESDTAAIVFRGELAGRRGYCWAQLHRWGKAEAEAHLALAAAREDVGAWYVLALVHSVRREFPAAHADLDTLFAIQPRHEEGRELEQALRKLGR